LLEEINKDERFDETPSFTPKSSIDYACAGGSILNDEWLPCTEKLPKFPLLIVETIGLYECHMFHNGICCINFISKHFVGKTKAKKNVKDLPALDWNMNLAKKKIFSTTNKRSKK